MLDRNLVDGLATISFRSGRVRHILDEDNGIKTICGKDIGSSDFAIDEPFVDEYQPVCKKCKNAADAYLERWDNNSRIS